MERQAKTEEGRTLGGGLLENGADLRCSALSSDMARTIIVTGVTTAGGAELGPGEDHGTGPYSRRVWSVKRA
jgi:hypothetical protein